MGRQLIKFDLAEIKSETIDLAIEDINAKIFRVAKDIAVSEAERQERIVTLAMAKQYLQLRNVADELLEASKHPGLGRKRFKAAMAAYERERRFSVVIEQIPMTEYIKGYHQVV